MGSGSHPVRGLRHCTNHSPVHAERILLPGLPCSVQSSVPESLPSLFRSPAMNAGVGMDRWDGSMLFRQSVTPGSQAPSTSAFLGERFLAVGGRGPKLFNGKSEPRSLRAPSSRAVIGRAPPCARGAGVIGPVGTTPPPGDAGHGRPSPKSSQCPRSGWNR